MKLIDTADLESAAERHGSLSLSSGTKDIMSPCIGVCKMEGNRCIGCLRTLEEIEEAGAPVAQLVECLICNQDVACSNHAGGTKG